MASATALVFVAMMWALSLCISHRAWICQKVKARLASALLFGRRCGEAADEERKYIDEKILEEKTELARKIVFVLLYFGVGNLMNILYNILMERPLWLSSSGCWIVVIAVLLMLLAQVPGMLSTRTVDLWSAILQLIVLAFLSELATSAHETLMLGSGLFVTVCVPAAAFANRRNVLLFCQLSFLLHALVRAFRDFEEFQRATECNALNGAQTFVMAHLIFLPLALTVSMWAHQLMEHRVESRFRESKSQTQLSAASALLDLTCDAVFELDADLRLQKNSGSLAALLMRNRAGATLKGLKFTDLVVPSDVQRVTQILDTKSEHGSADAMAHVFRTHLMDSYDSKFCAEVFQVKFTLASGAKCHIVGLRDVTDVQPLAYHPEPRSEVRSEVPEALQLEIKPPTGTYELESLSEFSRHPLSRRSSICSSPPMTPQTTDGDNRSANSKDVFLEIDVENEMLKSATAPLTQLAGRRLSDLTFSPFALQICKRLCRDAAAIESSNQVLPDQIASFNDMPLLVVAPHMMEASGFMRVSRSDGGNFHAMICVRKRKMSMSPDPPRVRPVHSL